SIAAYAPPSSATRNSANPSSCGATAKSSPSSLKKSRFRSRVLPAGHRSSRPQSPEPLSNVLHYWRAPFLRASGQMQTVRWLSRVAIIGNSYYSPVDNPKHHAVRIATNLDLVSFWVTTGVETL